MKEIMLWIGAGESTLSLGALVATIVFARRARRARVDVERDAARARRYTR